MDSSTLTLLTGSFLNERVSSYFLILPCFIEIPVFKANSVDSSHRPQLRRLILVYTVCQCPFYWTQGINALNEQALSTTVDLGIAYLE